jgi:hypothetical protein
VDPLEPGTEAEIHLRTCPACSEARVAYLAQEDCPLALAPLGYYERLPNRILRKLPLRPVPHHGLRPFTWATAAVLLMAVGAGAFWVGRANRVPLVEAAFPRPTEVSESSVVLADTPFHDGEEEASQIQALTPEEMKVFLKDLDVPMPSPR